MNEIQMKRSYKLKATIKVKVLQAQSEVVSAVTEHSLYVYPCISYCFLKTIILDRVFFKL